MEGYTPSEMMIIAAARALAGVKTVFVGIGLPNAACNLARRTVAPDLALIYESGVYGARPERLPFSIGDPALVTGALSIFPMPDVFALYLQGGWVEVAFLGAAQIDRFGNLNTTVIGDYHHPRVRLPGSGGACDIATHARRVFIVTRLQRRRFVERLDFVTSPGHLDGGNRRQELGIPGGGPALVVTDRAIFTFDDETREMTLSSLHPGVALEEVQAEVGWDLRVSPNLRETEPPTEEELRILREELDPQGIYR
ncbi:MAG TPA: CoA-transferase subunit beta [Anaerolineae bacterium]|nr:CoA-transferase subunit beta [Anaerolineae bacterium]